MINDYFDYIYSDRIGDLRVWQNFRFIQMIFYSIITYSVYKAFEKCTEPVDLDCEM